MQPVKRFIARQSRCCCRYASSSSLSLPTREDFESYRASTASTLAAAADSQTTKAERTLKRFWKDVTLAQDRETGSWSVMLDQRPLKTPSGCKLSLPRRKLAAATLIAHEWGAQSEMLKPHSLPMTSLASRAIDGLSDPAMKEQVIANLCRYLHTDTICFAEENKASALTRLQDEHWTPLVKWTEENFAVTINIARGQLFNRQSQDTVDKLAEVVKQYDAFSLAGFERAVMASKSYLIALGLMHGKLSVEAAANAAHVEVQSQIDRWGEVEDSQSAHASLAAPSADVLNSRITAHDVDHQDVRVRLGSAAIIAAPTLQTQQA